MGRNLRHRAIALFICGAFVAVSCSSGDSADSGTDGSDAIVETTEASGDTETAASTTEAPEDPPPSTDEPQFGGTLRIGVEADVQSLNPAGNALPAAGKWMAEAVFDTLVKVSAEGAVVPHLAESVEPNDDFTSWTVTLRDGVTFHDGAALDADAVVTTFSAQLGDPVVGLTVLPLMAPEDFIEKVDERTVRYNLSGPSTLFPLRLADQLGMVASPTWLAAIEDDPDLAQEPVGTGPFVFDSRTKDFVTRFVRNDDYWAGEVYLDAVEFYPVPDQLLRADQLEVGDLDILHAPGRLNALADSDVISSVYDAGGEEGFLALNTSQPPFDDIRARQAFTYTFAHDDLIEVIAQGDQAVKANQMFTPDERFFNAELVQLTDRPDLVGDLVDSYCTDTPEQCTDGRIDVEYVDTPGTGQERNFAVLNEGWRDHFNVTPRFVPQDQFIVNTVLGNFDVTQFRLFGGVDPELDRVYLLCESIGGISVNVPRYCDPEIDELLARQAASTDDAERTAIWQEIVQRINENFTHIWIGYAQWRVAYNSERVTNLCGATGVDGDSLRCVVLGATPLNQIWISD